MNSRQKGARGEIPMDVIEFLKSYEDLLLDAKSKYDAYVTQHFDIGAGAINNDGMPHGTNITDRTAYDADKLTEKRQSFTKAWNKAKKRYEEIEAMIELATNGKGRYVLRERYLCFRSLEDIANDKCLDRTGRTVRTYHDEAINEISCRYHGQTD